MEYRRSNLKLALGAGCALAVLAAATTVSAEERTFSVASTKATDAIPEFARQAGIQIVAPAEKLRGLNTPAVEGRYDTREALAMLIQGTGLRIASDDGRTVMLSADPQPGSAAGDGADAGTVQALVVTAQKREENIQDVPIAMSAFSQEDLTKSQVTGGPDLMTQVPNFTFTKTNFSSYSIQIRGIGTQAISATTDAAVAVAFNNTPFIRNRFFEQEFYDLQRVEVLRGPQGTLYGRNATAGVVNIISQKPKFTYESRLSLDVGNYNSHRLEGMLNIPLVEDKIALRIAGAWTKRDGYDTNQITGNRIDGRDLWSTRVSLRFTPTDRLDANLIWEHFQEDDDRLRSGKQLCKRHQPETIAGLVVPWGQGGPGSNNGSLYDETFSQGCEAASLYSPDSFQAPNGLRLPYYRPLARLALPIVENGPGGAFDPYASTTQSRDLRVIESTVDPIYKADTNTVELQVNFDLTDNLTLTSETGYLSDTLFSSEDYNRFNTRPGAFSSTATNAGRDAMMHGILSPDGYFCDPQVGCANRLVAMDLSTADSTQFSQEFRIGSNFDGPFNFSLGANFLRYDTEDKYYVFINTLSLYAASRAYFQNANRPPYQPGVSDNLNCLPQGSVAPDPNKIQNVLDCVYIDPNPVTSLNDQGHNYFLSKNPYKLISYAVFGEAYYKITNDLKLTAGLRWTVDKKEAPRIPSWVLGANTVDYPVAEVIEQEWREPTGRLALDWKPDLTFTDETLLYASYAHGYKAGGANPPAAGLTMYGIDVAAGAVDWGLLALQQAAVAPKTFKPEFVDAFEVGAKNTLLGGRLTLNGDAFYYDYTGYQISQIVNRSAINLNFDAKIWGAELESDWRPVENLRLGLKLGFEKTRMANGSSAVDMIDRANGGKPDANGVSWFVTEPFPTLPANCILPTYIVTLPGGVLQMLGAAGGGNLGPCEEAYVLGNDPVTNLPYQANPADPNAPPYYWYPGYRGFDPHTAPNGGAGISKDLSRHELPNAPHITATLTGDYTIPMPNSWLATLHTDLYYQSEAWTRVFNTPGYDKLKAYTNVNLAAIFTNEDLGWKVMAYVKNVFNHDSITGAFLNSDDTGLTTNVFLNEPRLYGLRVTKEFTGGPWWTGANPDHTGPYPLTMEISGQIQRQDAPYERFRPASLAGLPPEVALTRLQNNRLDWGDGREAKITYRPQSALWSVSADVRYGRTNSRTSRERHELQHNDNICGVGPFGTYAKYGAFYASLWCNPASAKYKPDLVAHGGKDWAQGSARDREEHTIVDFDVGHDVGLGSMFSHSAVGAGIRYAAFKSSSALSAYAADDWNIPEGWWKYNTSLAAPPYASSNHTFSVDLAAARKFKGAGPTLSWDAAVPLLGNDNTGRLNADWSVTGGVLFGKQNTRFSGQEIETLHQGNYSYLPLPAVGTPTVTPAPSSRNKSVSVPMVDLSLGLSYEVGRMKVGTGYRWERYFNVLDVGYDAHKDADRTFDGPYFKIAVGFGG